VVEFTTANGTPVLRNSRITAVSPAELYGKIRPWARLDHPIRQAVQGILEAELDVVALSQRELDALDKGG